jgi:hypothetical protein
LDFSDLAFEEAAFADFMPAATLGFCLCSALGDATFSPAAPFALSEAMAMRGDGPIRKGVGLAAAVGLWLVALPALALGGAAEPASYSPGTPELALPEDPVARVAYATVTLPAAEALAGDPQRVVIDFAGGDVALFGPESAVEPVVTLSDGTLLASTAEPHQGGWRLTIDFDPADARAIDVRAFLRLQSQALTEAWSWRWVR